MALDKQELEKALERERDENVKVLFPICIDNSIFNVGTGWASFLKNTRNIGDFCNWGNIENYKESLNRLLRDLVVTDDTKE